MNHHSHDETADLIAPGGHLSDGVTGELEDSVVLLRRR